MECFVKTSQLHPKNQSSGGFDNRWWEICAWKIENLNMQHAAFKSCKSCSFSTTLLPLKLVHVNCQPFCGFCQPTIFAKRFGDTLINQFSENQHFHLSWKLSWFQTFFLGSNTYVVQSSPHLTHPTHFRHSEAHSPNLNI